MAAGVVVLTVSLLGLAPGAGGLAPTPASSAVQRMVVLSTVRTKNDARREALRAARLLAYAIAFDTVSMVPRQRSYAGEVIAVHRGAGGSFVVTSYLGDASTARARLRAARRFFPTAEVRTAGPLPKDNDGYDWVEQPFSPAGLLLAGSYRSYYAAARAAQAFSAASGIPYSTEGMIFDESRGLILPDDAPDEIYRGQYVFRRYDACGSGSDWKTCVTVERSEGYDGLRPGLYIVVAGIVGGDEEAKTRLEQARRIVPSAYVKQTVLYMGCMH